MVDREDAESTIKKLIEEYVDDQWKSTESVCYLSSLGVRLNQTALENRDVLSKGLREFLRQNPVVRVVQFPSVAEKVGAIPLSVPLPEDVRELFTINKSSFGLQNRNVYVQEFWEAFIRPIEGHSRYIVVNEPGSMAISEAPPDDETKMVYEITEQDLTNGIPGESILEKVNATHSAIDTWLKKNSLNHGIFLRPRGGKKNFSVDNRLAIFLRAFDGLSSEDLARVHLPLDIVLKLITKK